MDLCVLFQEILGAIGVPQGFALKKVCWNEDEFENFQLFTRGAQRKV